MHLTFVRGVVGTFAMLESHLIMKRTKLDRQPTKFPRWFLELVIIRLS